MMYSAKKEFVAGNVEKGRQIQAEAVEEINNAVAMKPDEVAVLIPRAAVFLSDCGRRLRKDPAAAGADFS